MSFVKVVREKLRLISDLSEAVATLILLVAPIVLILSVWQPILSPFVTSMFVIWGTVEARKKGRSFFIASIGGIMIYLASWFSIDTYGVIGAQLFCGAGVVMWFSALSTPKPDPSILPV